MKISLILPCYNEELNIQKGVLDKVANYTVDDSRFLEIIVVDDGSTDMTPKIIKSKYVKKFSKLRFIQNKHQGKAFAVIAGIRQAKGDYVAFSDFDLATPIEEIEKLIEKAKKGATIVIGSRSGQREGAPIARRVMAKGFMIIRDMSIGLKGIRDTQCGFKLFKKDVAICIIEKLKVFNTPRQVRGSSVNAGFDLEFLFLAEKMGEKISEVPVTWKHVETKNVHFVNDSLETLRDIYKIKMTDLQRKYNV